MGPHARGREDSGVAAAVGARRQAAYSIVASTTGVHWPDLPDTKQGVFMGSTVMSHLGTLPPVQSVLAYCIMRHSVPSQDIFAE